MRRTLALLTFVVLVATFGRIAVTRAFSSYYIDYASGSNANAGTKVSPWKSAPGMQQGAGCAGATHSYTHVSGDKFIFKGGVTWPTACFQITLFAGGTSTAQDYWGVCLATDLDSPCFGGTSWPSSGWTRPIWGGSNGFLGSGDNFFHLNGAHDFTAPSFGYITLDNIEIGNWNVVPQANGNGNTDLYPAIVMGGALNFAMGTGTVVENMFIHDWVADTSATPTAGTQAFAYGMVYGASVLKNSTISDQSGYYKVNGTTINWPFMGGCAGCGEVSNNKFAYLWMACSSAFSCHDNELDHIEEDNSGLTYNNPPSGLGIHGHAIYEDAAGIETHYVYNNYIHDGNTPLVIQVFYEAAIFNNVISNMTGNGAIYLNQCEPGLGTPPCGDNSSQVGYVVNNTIDMSTTTMPCYKWFGTAGLGTLYLKNNICIPSASGGTGSFSVANPQTSNNRNNMSTSEATTYGFVPTNKYAPSSSDPFTVGQGANLSSFCSGGLSALCLDPRGAPWFGASYIARGSNFDIGAFQFAGGSVGPPMSSVTAPTNGATISGATVSLTATCTPQSPATCTNTQIFVDGAAFGSGGSVTLDSTRIANGTHTIYAVVTDSNMQTGTASTVTVTVNNVAPGCFTTNPAGSTVQGFTAQTTTVTVAWDETPNSTGTNDTVVGVAQTPAIAYSQMSALVRSNTSGFWDAYDGATGTYHAANPAPYVGSTLYHFVATLTFSGGNFLNYSVSETVPSSIVIATGWTPRAAATSLAYLVGISDAGIYDTAKVCNFVVGSSTSLSFAPTSLNFGPQTVSTMMTLSTAVTSVGGSTTFTSATAAGTGFSKTADSCAPNTTASCSITVQFDPPSTGPFSGSLTLVDSATGSPHVIPLSGTGIAASPTISPSPLSLNFGGVRLANPPLTVFAGPVTVTINNPPTTFTSVTPTGGDAADFGVSGSSTCVGTVSAPTCSITASFSPSRIGAETTTLVISSSDATNSPQNVTLTATGQIPAPPVAPSNSMFMASVTKTFQVPLTINGLPIGTVPFDAKINFICADCDPVKQTCGTCTAQ